MIENKLNEELMNRFCPPGSNLQKHHTKLLELLQAFDQICRDNDINYWISSGTALGAVRHGGFIPWDDDADVEMLRSDFEKLQKNFLLNDKYALQTKNTDFYYSAPYGKFRDLNSIIVEHPQDYNYKYKGVYIDIFVLDKMPSKILFKICGRLGWPLVLRGGAVRNKWSKITYSLHKYVLHFFFMLLRYIFQIIPSKKYRHCLGSTFPKPRYLQDILPLRDINFEGITLKGPNNMDSYLKNIYGDYMSLPDLNNIHPHISDIKIFK